VHYFTVASEKILTIQHHISRDKLARVEFNENRMNAKQNNQVPLTNLTNNNDQSSFNFELRETLLAANTYHLLN